MQARRLRDSHDVHGGNLHRLAQCAGRLPSEVLDFSANINPLGMPAAARAAILASLDTLVHYPDPGCTELRALLGAHLGVAPERIVAGNGAEQLIWWLPRLLAAKRVLVTAPAYLDYERAAAVWGLPVVRIALEASSGFVLDLERLQVQLRPGDLVWLGQPNNPTGAAIDPDALFELVRCHGPVFWAIDEAFIEFAESLPSAAAWALPNLVVVRSMTKFYALAGLRLGYAVLPAVQARELMRLLPDWSVNHLALSAGMAILGDPRLKLYSDHTRDLVREQRQWLTERLEALGISTFPSRANYLLCRLPEGPGQGAVQLAGRLLHDAGIAVRVCDNYAGLNDRYLRIAVRRADENARLVDALAAAVIA